DGRAGAERLARGELDVDARGTLKQQLAPTRHALAQRKVVGREADSYGSAALHRLTIPIRHTSPQGWIRVNPLPRFFRRQPPSFIALRTASIRAQRNEKGGCTGRPPFVTVGPRGARYSCSATWLRPIRRAICLTFIFCS